MESPAEDAETIAVSAFKPRSLELIERVASGRVARLVLTNRGRPVAALVPVQQRPAELWGALRDVMEPVPDVDLTSPTGEAWAAEDGWSAPASHLRLLVADPLRGKALASVRRASCERPVDSARPLEGSFFR